MLYVIHHFLGLSVTWHAVIILKIYLLIPITMEISCQNLARTVLSTWPDAWFTGLYPIGIGLKNSSSLKQTWIVQLKFIWWCLLVQLLLSNKLLPSSLTNFWKLVNSTTQARPAYSIQLIITYISNSVYDWNSPNLQCNKIQSLPIVM